LLVAHAGHDPDRLEELVQGRCSGEPLAWLVGSIRFGGEQIHVDPGVYVPRPQSEWVVETALGHLPDDGTAVDLCTGSGAIAAVLTRRRPQARVVATEIDPVAADCARANGVEVYLGDLAGPLPTAIVGVVDVVTAVAPYVPTDALDLLPRDVLTYEPRRALDGGQHGLRVLRRVVDAAAGLLHPGGWLVVELGADQDVRLAPDLSAHGFTEPDRFADGDGDLRGLSCRWRGRDRATRSFRPVDTFSG